MKVDLRNVSLCMQFSLWQPVTDRAPINCPLPCTGKGVQSISSYGRARSLW